MFTKEDCSKTLQIENRSLSCQRWTSLVTTRLSNMIAFHLRLIWLQTLVAIDSELRLTSFPSFARRHLKSLRYSIWIWADSLFSARSSIQTCCFAQDLIRNMWFCSYVVFWLSHQWMIERFSGAMGEALVGNNFVPIPSKISFHMKKKRWLVAARNLQSIKTLLALELSQCSKSGSMFKVFFKQASRGQQRLLRTRKRPVFVLASPTCASWARERPQELGRWFAL